MRIVFRSGGNTYERVLLRHVPILVEAISRQWYELRPELHGQVCRVRFSIQNLMSLRFSFRCLKDEKSFQIRTQKRGTRHRKSRRRAMDKEMLFQELWISLRQIKDEPIESTEISVLLTILMVCKRVIQ